VPVVGAAQVEQWTADAGRSLFLCDVRTAEEFATGTLPGAQHAPGGQLIQSTDLYVGVRQARVVLFDNDGVRAPIIASWLRQLGHQVFVLSDGLSSGLVLPAPAVVTPERLPLISVQALADALKDDAVALIDLRSSRAYRHGHIAGARWSIRPLLTRALAGEQRPLVLVADDPRLAALAALELPQAEVRLLEGGPDAWRSAGLALREGVDTLPDAQCIDFLFFTHDRHAGNKDAARQYLAWEIGLLAQMSAEEIASLKPLHEPVQGAVDERLRTRLIHGARTEKGSGARTVNVPVSRLSTVLFDNLAQMRDARSRRDSERVLTYGARGNPTAFALEDLVTELEGGYRARLFGTGLAAVAQTFLAYLRPGDHVLITDAVYAPVRRVARDFLEAFGVAVEYFAPDGCDLPGRLRANTKMVYTEVPGSLLYELCDLPAIAALCKSRGILLAVDNTWGSGVLYRPLALGADISIMALTKYLGGHSDVVMGSVCTRQEAWPALAAMSDTFGNTVSPDDAYLVLRGARTLAPRLETHERQALEIARWLQAQPQVKRVFHPALPEHPGHRLWQRDFKGSNGLLSFELREKDDARLERFIDALQVFGLGASWGGFESLVTVADTQDRNSAEDRALNPVVRLHVGLEDVGVLIEDLQRGFIAAG
jgi:cystathionine beta-lyase